MKSKLIFALLLLLPLLSIPMTVKADGIIIPEPPICDPGSCGWVPISQLVIRYHRVDVRIEDQLAVTHVDQVFYNPNDWTIEGTYIFPIPAGAVVTNFALWIDGEPVQGQILEAEQARRTYEEIIHKIQDPALLEYANRNAVQARIFPIEAGKERRIELEYTEVLQAENGLVRYLYPLNTEKFSTQPLDEVRVRVDVKSNLPVRAAYSPSHPIAFSKDGDHHFTVGYEESGVKPDMDFVLYYSIGKNEAFHLLSFRDPTDAVDSDGFFLMLLAPRPGVDSQTLPKDVLLVLDRSGSMEGEKFSQAQDALKYILQHLNPEDRFNIISFSTGIEQYAESLRDVSETGEALRWVDRLSALGSTDINRALLEAAALADQERPTYIIFLTDGLPTEGVIESDLILNNFAAVSRSNLRLFAFGVGYDVDTFLLDSLAQENHGTSTYVLPGEPLDEIVSGFYAKISTPVLTDLNLDFEEIEVYDLYPSPLPDLFDGSQIVVVGRYRQGGKTDVILSGLVNNRPKSFVFPGQVFTSDSLRQQSEIQNLEFIARLWATRKIGYLLNQVRLHGPEQELLDQIVRLSIRYGIITPYTSYLVTENVPLGAEEQGRIAKEEFLAMEAAPAEPTFGRDAVEKAAGQGEMAGAEAVASAPAEATSKVRVVGSRTFVLVDGVWMDTAFDPEEMRTQKVAFLSDDYFDLAGSHVDLAAAFALGSKVVAISGGIAYEVVDPGSPVDEIEIPSRTEPNPVKNPYPEQLAPSVESGSQSPAGSSRFPCLGGLLPLVMAPMGIFVRRFRR